MRSRTYYFARYREFLGDECERCGSDKNLLVHHRDDDFTNNNEENLETLCRRCHQIHHRCADNLPDNTGRVRTRHPQECAWCGREFVRHAGYTVQKCCSRSCAQRRRFALV